MKETWILYQTTNNVNGKIYVGVHKVSVSATSKRYLGSGYALKLAFKKYDRKNFVRITLAEFSCAENAYLAEAEMVTEEFIKRPDTYNMKIGGMGGTNSFLGKTHSKETKAKIGAASKGRKMSEANKAALLAASNRNNKFLGKKHTEEAKAKIKIGNTGKIISPETKAKISAAQTGKVLSEEHKAKIGLTKKGNKNCLGRVMTLDNKEKIRAANTGKVLSIEHREKIGANNPRNVAVVVNGVYYPTKKFAAKAENVSKDTVSDRIKSSKSKWDGWRLATEEEKRNYMSNKVQ